MMNYDSTPASSYHERWKRNAVELYQHKYWEPVLSKALKKHCQGNGLDLGCGTGTHLIQQNDAYIRIGVDLSMNMLQFAKKQGKEFLVNGSAEHLPIRPGSLDWAYSFGLLEYVDAATMLNEVHRVLRSGSRFLLFTPNKYGGRKWLSMKKRLWRKQAVHARYYSRREIVTLLKEAGFVTHGIQMKDGLVYLPGRTPAWCALAVFKLVEWVFRLFPYNPWSQNMLFITTRG